MIHVDKKSINYDNIYLLPGQFLQINNEKAVILRIYYATPQMLPFSVKVMFWRSEKQSTFRIEDLVNMGAIDDGV